MSIAVLGQVYDEMRRLAIAGGAVAAGDFRLKKLVAPLEAGGQKAPVFARVAQAVQAVVDSNEKTASAALLELTTLVNAILYTQGETGIAGELKPLETTDLGAQVTQAGARTLKPLLEALSSTGSGRLELIRDAQQRGAFKDLRLVKAAINAIDDPYPEIADLIVQNVLPMYGKAIIPQLRTTLDIKARGGHLHRLQLLHKLDPEGSRELIQQALTEGSKEMKVAAIECLGTTEADLTYLLEQSRAKAKDVRAAALRALTAAGATTGEVMAALKKAIDGADVELIVDRMRTCSVAEIQDYVLHQAEQQLANVLKLKDKKEQGPAITRLQHLVSCLRGRTDAKAETFLLRCFADAPKLEAIKSEPSGSDFNELVAHILSQGTPKMQKELVAKHKSLAGGALQRAVFAARSTMPSAVFFNEFSAMLKGVSAKRTKKNSVEHDRAMAVLAAIAADDDIDEYYFGYGMRFVRYSESREKAQESKLPPLDPRWLDAAIEADSVELACKLARPNHEGVRKFLSEQLAASKRPHDHIGLLQTMVRINHPDSADAIIAALKKHAKDASHYYLGYWYGPMISELPKSALPKFEEVLPTLPEKMVDQLMESVIALKNKPE